MHNCIQWIFPSLIYGPFVYLEPEVNATGEYFDHVHRHMHIRTYRKSITLASLCLGERL